MKGKQHQLLERLGRDVIEWFNNPSESERAYEEIARRMGKTVEDLTGIERHIAFLTWQIGKGPDEHS